MQKSCGSASTHYPGKDAELLVAHHDQVSQEECCQIVRRKRRKSPAATYWLSVTCKSTEEGLAQAFVSLDAQGETCSAYIRSQRHEGWEQATKTYDDGGYSGGSMDRPALQTLIQYVSAGLVDVFVIYKIHRLARAESSGQKGFSNREGKKRAN